MCTVEISTTRDSAGADVVLIKDRDMEEVMRMEALSPEHARDMARDCAMLVVRTGRVAVVLR